jgi:hypothetical protein
MMLKRSLCTSTSTTTTSSSSKKCLASVITDLQAFVKRPGSLEKARGFEDAYCTLDSGGRKEVFRYIAKNYGVEKEGLQVRDNMLS